MKKITEEQKSNEVLVMINKNFHGYGSLCSVFVCTEAEYLMLKRYNFNIFVVEELGKHSEVEHTSKKEYVQLLSSEKENIEAFKKFKEKPFNLLEDIKERLEWMTDKEEADYSYDEDDKGYKDEVCKESSRFFELWKAKDFDTMFSEFKENHTIHTN